MTKTVGVTFGILTAANVSPPKRAPCVFVVKVSSPRITAAIFQTNVMKYLFIYVSVGAKIITDIFFSETTTVVTYVCRLMVLGKPETTVLR